MYVGIGATAELLMLRSRLAGLRMRSRRFRPEPELAQHVSSGLHVRPPLCQRRRSYGCRSRYSRTRLGEPCAGGRNRGSGRSAPASLLRAPGSVPSIDSARPPRHSAPQTRLRRPPRVHPRISHPTAVPPLQGGGTAYGKHSRTRRNLTGRSGGPHAAAARQMSTCWRRPGR